MIDPSPPSRTQHRASALILSLLLAACGQPSTATQNVPSNPAANDVAAMKNDIAAVEDRVTRDTLTRRVDDLEKRVGALEVTPEKIDLDLLTQRVQALETKSSVSDLADRPVPRPTPSKAAP
ncbi:hypothetical protein SAMN05216382_1444 [Sphingomonas palmae]|uniref:Murein lipoprotein n=2 Tax=Sphingomonas palmae TaxID=1855283 RepID=A0A1H7MDH4_9SPHN|nr:hypothetical protein SAMN05216382_1444 [Sphingomonas palmae]